MGYGFTRVWGAITIGIGLAILLGTPLVAVLAALVVQAESAAMRNQPLLVPVALVTGLVVGFLVGGICIVSGQLLRIAVHSLHLQSAMLERLDELATPWPDDRWPVGGSQGRRGTRTAEAAERRTSS
jgi:hypothetical protein